MPFPVAFDEEPIQGLTVEIQELSASRALPGSRLGGLSSWDPVPHISSIIILYIPPFK